MVCMNCGQQYDGNVCPRCGAPAMQQQFTQQPYVQQPMMGGGFVVEKRSIATCIILSIVTLGIYAIYWMIKLHDEVHAVSNEQPTVSGGMLILLALVTFGIYTIYWAYKQGERIDRIHAMRGVPAGNNAVLYLVLDLVGVGIVSLALMQNELNTYA